MRDGGPTTTTDAAHDAAVTARLLAVDREALTVVGAIGDGHPPRAVRAAALEHRRRVAEGEKHMFTGVMCGCYHDVWMELHEDLILTLGIDRAPSSF